MKIIRDINLNVHGYTVKTNIEILQGQTEELFIILLIIVISEEFSSYLTPKIQFC